MSIFDLSDEHKKRYLIEKPRLLKNLRENIQKAHKDEKELFANFNVSQHDNAIIELYSQYVIQKSNVTPKDETMEGIIGKSHGRISSRNMSEEDFERAHEDIDKEIKKYRKMLSVLRSYENVSRSLHLMSLKGAEIKEVWNQIRIDGGDTVQI